MALIIGFGPSLGRVLSALSRNIGVTAPQHDSLPEIELNYGNGQQESLTSASISAWTQSYSMETVYS